MTNKQITTLMLFAQNYSLPVIAKKQQVSLTTIRQRIKALSANHSREFNNALGIRESYKRTRDGIRDAKRNSEMFQRDFEWDTRVEIAGDIPLRTFDYRDIPYKDRF